MENILPRAEAETTRRGTLEDRSKCNVGEGRTRKDALYVADMLPVH